MAIDYHSLIDMLEIRVERVNLVSNKTARRIIFKWNMEN